MQILIGDQLTCKIIRGAKKWRESEVIDIQRLQWAHEVPGIQAYCAFFTVHSSMHTCIHT